MNRACDVVVIGAGPAGLLAAGRAAMLGAKVLLLEKMEKPARKLRITGKGRCNLTNMRPLEEQLKEIHPEPRFLRQAFGAFSNLDLIALLEAGGVPTKTERGQRVFPASDRAWDVAEALVAWAKGQGVEIVGRARVERLRVEDGAFAGLEYLHGGATHRVDARCGIVATGGLSYPATGSTGDGLAFAEAAGHAIAPTRPSLVGVRTEPVCAAAGLRLRNVNLTLWVDGRKKASEFGEAEFTDEGLDGPIVLRLSRQIVDHLAAGRRVEVVLDLKPSLDVPTLEARLDREFTPATPLREVLRSLLPAQLVEPFAARLGPSPRRGQLIALLKELRFRVTGHGSWDSAIVTAGGVALKGVDPRTLGSRVVANLFFAGEVLDLDANTGGYNLQIAFSTGWLAGASAAQAALSLRQ